MVKVTTCSMKKREVEEDCKLWASIIAQDYQPDIIIFVEKSGFLFAKPIAEILKCPMVGIRSTRPHDSAKEKGRKFVNLFSERLLLKILSSSIMYKYNEIRKKREFNITEKFLEASKKNYKKILVIDDSVDTGWTILGVKKEIQKYFFNVEIKIASYSLIEYSKKRVSVDYYRHFNKLVLTATSRKSEEYSTFLKEYEEWKA